MADGFRKHLNDLTDAGIAEAADDADGQALVSLTDAGRLLFGGVAMSATRWERRYRPEQSAPVGVVDGDLLLRALLPLVRLPVSVSGTCAMTMRLDPVPGAPRSLTVWARLRSGRVREHSCQPLRPAPSASACGSVDEWLDALLDNLPERLEIKGRRELAVALIEGIYTQLPGRRDPSMRQTFEEQRERTRRRPAARTAVRRTGTHPPGAMAAQILGEIGDEGVAILEQMDGRPGERVDEAALAMDDAKLDARLDRLNALGLTEFTTPE